MVKMSLPDNMKKAEQWKTGTALLRSMKHDIIWQIAANKIKETGKYREC